MLFGMEDPLLLRFFRPPEKDLLKGHCTVTDLPTQFSVLVSQQQMCALASA